MRYSDRFIFGQLWMEMMFITLPCLFFISCMDEKIVTGPGSDATSVLISIEVPVASYPAAARALTPVQEQEVSTIDVLIFDKDGGFNYLVSTNQIISQSEQVRIFELPLIAGSFDMVFLANARDILENAYPGLVIATGTAMSTVQQKLMLQQNGKWSTNPAAPDYRSIPMWGEKKGVTITNTTTGISGIRLHRMLARINIIVEADNFSLEEIYLYHPCQQGLLVPNASSWGGTNAYEASWLNSWSRSSAVWSYTPTEYNAVVNEIYIPEVIPGDPEDITKNTFLVLGGIYDTDQTVTYYRLDFLDYFDNTLTYLPLLRNHTYDFTITGAYSSGAATPDRAIAAGPENLAARLLFDNDFKLGYYKYTDKYFIGIASDHIYTRWFDDDITMALKTDVPDDVQFKLSTSPTDPDAGDPDWIYLPETVLPNTATQLDITLQNNATTEKREAYLHITAGNFSLVSKVMQDKPVLKPAVGVVNNDTYFLEIPDDEAANCIMRGAFSPTTTSDTYKAFRFSVYPQVSKAMKETGNMQLPADWLTLKKNGKWAVQVLWSDKPLGWKSDDKSQRSIKAIALHGDSSTPITETSGHGILIIQGASSVGVGNSVVILFEDVDGDGVYNAAAGDEIRWSWHIWRTTYTMSTTNTWGTWNNVAVNTTSLNLASPANNTYLAGTYVSAGALYKMHTGRKTRNMFMDRNLGCAETGTFHIASQAPDESVKMQGLQYQWGRKDPFPEIEGASFKTIYFPDGTTSNTINTYSKGNEANLLQYSIKNPSVFITGDDWYPGTDPSQEDNLWGGVGTPGVYPPKSAYDPCPYLFRVTFGHQSDADMDYNPWGLDGKPTRGSITDFTDVNQPVSRRYVFPHQTGGNVINYGYMPLAGYISSTGTPTGNEKEGFWATASPNTTNPGYITSMRLTSSDTADNDVDQTYAARRGQSFSIRCVRDQNYIFF